MSSQIFLQLRLQTSVPISGYNLEYDVKYSTHQHAWSEDNIANQIHTSQPHDIEYIYNAERQNVSNLISNLHPYR